MRRGRGRGWIPRQGAEPAHSSLLSRPTSRRAHLVDVAVGPGPHALQQLKAVPRVLQRHIPQQRHGPAPGGPPRAAEQRSRRGAARGGIGRDRQGRRLWLRCRVGGAGARGGARGVAPSTRREEAPKGLALSGVGKPRGSSASHQFPRSTGEKPEGPEGRRKRALHPQPRKFPDEAWTCTFFFTKCIHLSWN